LLRIVSGNKFFTVSTARISAHNAQHSNLTSWTYDRCFWAWGLAAFNLLFSKFFQLIILLPGMA